MRSLSATTLMSSVIPLWDKSLSLSRLRNAGEEPSFYGAVEGWILPATPSGSIGGRTPLPTVRSEGLRSPAFRKVGWLVHFDRLVHFAHKYSGKTLSRSSELIANSSKVSLRYMKDVEIYLEQDLRMDMDMDEFYKMDTTIFEVNQQMILAGRYAEGFIESATFCGETSYVLAL